MTTRLAAQQSALLDMLQLSTTNLIACYAGNMPGESHFFFKKSASTLRGLRAYRANAQVHSEGALQATYPILQQLLGAENFQNLAQDFWRDAPPERGDLAQWGCALAAYLSHVPQLQALLQTHPFLPDVVRVEWALHRAATGSDAALDMPSFQQLASHDPADLRLCLSPGSAVLRSAYPVVAIIEHHDVRMSDMHDAARATIASGAAKCQPPPMPASFSAIELIGLAASMSLLAGWRLYLVVFAVGLAMHSGWIALPEQLKGLDVLANYWVIGAAGVGAVAEFFADKVMWLDSAVPYAVLDHDSAKVELHGIDDRGAHTAAGGAANDHSGIHAAQVQPLREASGKKGRCRHFSQHPFAGNGRELGHDLRHVRVFGQAQERWHFHAKHVLVCAVIGKYHARVNHGQACLAKSCQQGHSRFDCRGDVRAAKLRFIDKTIYKVHQNKPAA